MSATRIAYRYAKSLIDQSMDSNAVDLVKTDLDAFSKVLEVRDFALMLKSPIIHADKKKAIFNDVFGGKVSELTQAFFNIIISKGREGYLPDIVSAFSHQYDELKKRSKVKLTTAQRLNAEQVEEVKSKILASKVTHPDVEVDTAVDEELIGGFVLDVGDKRYDSSIKSKLKALKKTFSEDFYQKKY